MCGLFTYICVVLVVNVGEYTIHIHTPSIWVCTIHAMSTLDYPWPLRKKSDSWLFRLPTLQMFIARHVTWGLKMPQLKKKQNFAKRRSTLDTFWPALWKKNTFSFKTAQIRRRQPKKKEKHQHDAQFETVPIPPIPQIPPHCPTTQNQPRNLETAPSSKVFFEDVWHPKQWRDSRNFGPTSSGCGPSISIPGDSEAEWFHGNLNTMLFGGDWIPSSSETMTMDWFGIGKGPILRSFSWNVAVTCTYR